jgi:hypothetical protein
MLLQPVILQSTLDTIELFMDRPPQPIEALEWQLYGSRKTPFIFRNCPKLPLQVEQVSIQRALGPRKMTG